MDTSTKVKEKYFLIFWREVGKRIKKGRGKYKIDYNPDKEITDLADELVPNFMLGDVVKYLGEYLNTKDEKDLFDACGMIYICWLRNK